MLHAKLQSHGFCLSCKVHIHMKVKKSPAHLLFLRDPLGSYQTSQPDVINLEKKIHPIHISL